MARIDDSMLGVRLSLFCEGPGPGYCISPFFLCHLAWIGKGFIISNYSPAWPLVPWLWHPWVVGEWWIWVAFFYSTVSLSFYSGWDYGHRLYFSIYSFSPVVVFNTPYPPGHIILDTPTCWDLNSCAVHCAWCLHPCLFKRALTSLE